MHPVGAGRQLFPFREIGGVTQNLKKVWVFVFGIGFVRGKRVGRRGDATMRNFGWRGVGGGAGFCANKAVSSFCPNEAIRVWGGSAAACYQGEYIAGAQAFR